MVDVVQVQPTKQQGKAEHSIMKAPNATEHG
eukprot:CAMPEP_0206137766 /NCGR_PEP_ID=MMETSP1473-20131121/2833_1 /ASSEMBLY_ACC=CAM_ASM_001109 /TAXON_ID=1461547 /ORGANISM="Stichococcus sp, Strain RCC1054" /LENGTH=30 /DNA_ID= /DNA_START= /DNA_END= /DNA_ORIENTATION=